MSEPIYRVKLTDETNFKVKDISEDAVVRVLPARGADGSNFEPTIVDSLPETGDSSKLYLTPKAHDTQTATGNPISLNISEGAGSIESLKLDGDTFQQSYTGKNLLNVKDNLKTSDRGLDFSFSDNKLVVSGTPIVAYANITDQIDVDLPAGDYTLSISNAINHRLYLRVDYEDSTIDDLCVVNAGSTYRTSAFAKKAVKIRLDFSLLTTETALNESFAIQLESGSTATSFEPYVGGTASPNPDYPQAIQTVTGVQTISINGTDHEIDLGSIELCKLGDSQDYIWKDGNEWKIRQNYIKITDLGGSSWIWNATIPSFSKNGAGLGIAGVATNAVWDAVSNKFIAGSFDQVCTNKTNGMAYSPSGFISVVDTSWTDVATARASLSGGVIYCRSRVPNDTLITDTALIAQLEAVRTAQLANGSNTITNTATGDNLAGDLELGYYGYSPTNRYDKWLWLQTGWESL